MCLELYEDRLGWFKTGSHISCFAFFKGKNILRVLVCMTSTNLISHIFNFNFILPIHIACTYAKMNNPNFLYFEDAIKQKKCIHSVKPTYATNEENIQD
jgi:hypothetical protein